MTPPAWSPDFPALDEPKFLRLLADLGTPRSYRDRRDLAMEAARLIKSKNPHSMVEVKDLQSGDVTAAALRPTGLHRLLR